MSSTADQLAALGIDPSFRLRVQSLMIQQAAVIYGEAAVAITAVTNTNPGVVQTTTPHGFVTGQTVTISGTNTTPSVNGPQLATVVDTTHFSVSVNVSVAGGAAGTVVLPARRAYALQVVANPVGAGASAAVTLANRTNLVAANTSYDFKTQRVITDASDGSLQSQIASDWNLLAGV